MVRMIFLHCFRTALLMLILTCALSHAASDSLKTLPAQIDVSINWNTKEGTINKSGSLLMQITGTMELKPDSVRTPKGQALVPVILRYSLDGLTGNYNYQETITDNGELQKAFKGSGSLTPAQNGLMRVNRIKHIASAYINKLAPNQKQFLAQIPGQELLLDYYDFSCGFAAQPSKVSGKCRDNSPSGFSECKKKIGVGGMLLGFKIPDSGLMKGRRMWTASTVRNFSLSDLPPRMKRPAFKPAMVPEGRVNYDVTWSFGDAVLKPLDVEVSKVSFKYGSQNANLSLWLWHHGPARRVKAPEWVRDDVNEPAAFVRGYPFRVKAVFECHRPVEAAEEIRATEAGLKGSAFGGELTKVGDLTISGNQISGEFIIKKPQKVIGTHKVCWQWEGDIEFKGEPGKITTNLGSSEHEIYIVGAEPVERIRAYKHAAKLSCEWAKGLTGGDGTFQKIWDSFWDIPAPNGGTLAYKHSTPTRPGTTDELLTEGGGNCGSWADFFRDTVGIHGIEISKVGVYPNTLAVSGPAYMDRIVVKRAIAQGNFWPSRVFEEHVLNKYNGIYYDPSYHKMVAGSLNEYENEMFLGYCSESGVINSGRCSHIQQPAANSKSDEWAQYFELIAECQIDGDDKTACVPNKLDECEVDEDVISF